MVSVTQLDLTKFKWPMCLLEFNRVLNQTESGCDLEVLIQDLDVIKTVEIIIENSSSRITKIKNETEQVRIHIHKD